MPLDFVDGNNGLEGDSDPSVANDIRPFYPLLAVFFTLWWKLLRSGQLNSGTLRSDVFV